MIELQESSSIIPTYNADGKHFTPGFVLPSLEVEEEHYL